VSVFLHSLPLFQNLIKTGFDRTSRLQPLPSQLNSSGYR